MKESISTPAQNYGLRQSISISIIEITAVLELKSLVYAVDSDTEDSEDDNETWTIEKSYYGKSTRRVSAKQNAKEELANQREEMTKEAKKAALMECFRERLGFTEFKDIVCDELNRPMTV